MMNTEQTSVNVFTHRKALFPVKQNKHKTR